MSIAPTAMRVIEIGAVSTPKWFVRHVLEYDGGFPWSGDVPCVARLFACAS